MMSSEQWDKRLTPRLKNLDPEGHYFLQWFPCKASVSVLAFLKATCGPRIQRHVSLAPGILQTNRELSLLITHAAHRFAAASDRGMLKPFEDQCLVHASCNRKPLHPPRTPCRHRTPRPDFRRREAPTIRAPNASRKNSPKRSLHKKISPQEDCQDDEKLRLHNAQTPGVLADVPSASPAWTEALSRAGADSVT